MNAADFFTAVFVFVGVMAVAFLCFMAWVIHVVNEGDREVEEARRGEQTVEKWEGWR